MKSLNKQKQKTVVIGIMDFTCTVNDFNCLYSWFLKDNHATCTINSQSLRNII